MDENKQPQDRQPDEADRPGEQSPAGTETPQPEDGAPTAEEAAVTAGGEADEGYEKLFTVTFDISADELFNFQLVMAREQIEKNKKRSRIISIAEIVLGFVYLFTIVMGKVPAGLFQVALVLALIAMGVYGLCYYKYFFLKALRKSVNKQHARVPYFNTQVELDIYPNRCVERFQDKSTPNYWRDLIGVSSGPDAFYLQLDSKHCLLVPKRCAGSELEPFLRRMCADFEKQWREVA